MILQHFGLKHLPLSKESPEIWDDGSLTSLRESFQWLLHTPGLGLLSGGAGARLYFDAERIGGTAVVLIGYFGDHLPSVQFPS